MRISKLITWQWGSLESREWSFSDAVLLTGESGSGKSTLLDSIQTLLTAAHQHLVQFNIGQDESTQSRRGGKEPRTLAAYALGQQADGVFQFLSHSFKGFFRCRRLILSRRRPGRIATAIATRSRWSNSPALADSL